MTQYAGFSYIASEWVQPQGQVFHPLHPATNEHGGAYFSCGSAEIDRASTAAVTAFAQLRRLDGADVAAFLRAIAEQVEALGDELLYAADLESALGLPRLTGGRGRTCGQLRAFADQAAAGEWVQASIYTAEPERSPVPKPDIRRMMRPLGPIAVFGASNFPFAFGSLGGDSAAALAAGNLVIVKGHPAHPRTSELFAQAVDAAISSCGMPAGTFSLLQGVGNELGTELVADPRTAAVGFTGSLAAGRALMDVAAARPQPIPVFAEMGSINPVFIGPNTLAAQAKSLGSNLAASVCMGTGQFCTSPGVVVTTADAAFEQQLARRTGQHGSRDDAERARC